MTAKKDTVLTKTDYKNLVPAGQDPNVYLKLVKEQILGGSELTANDFNLFLYACKRAGLDPLMGQIHAVARWNSKLGRNTMAIQTGIDGFRLVAQRTGDYAGQDDVVFSCRDPRSNGPTDESRPTTATVTVYKIVQGSRVGFTASARWDEYKQEFKKKGGELQLSHMWAKMPYTMLGKCAESLALRKAFPNELSGIYTSDEMSQSRPQAPTVQDLPTPERFDKTKSEAPGSTESEEKPKKDAVPQTGGKDSTAKPAGAQKAKEKVVADSPSEARKKLLEGKTNGNKS